MAVSYIVLEPDFRTPKELAGYVPGGITNGGPVPTTIGPRSPVVLIPFGVEGLSGSVDLGVLSAGLQEVTPRVRVWFDFAGNNLARIQGRIDQAGNTGEKVVVLWDNLGTWDWLGVDQYGVNGPVMDVLTSGDIRGPEITLSTAVIAAGDVLLGFFTFK